MDFTKPRDSLVPRLLWLGTRVGQCGVMASLAGQPYIIILWMGTTASCATEE